MLQAAPMMLVLLHLMETVPDTLIKINHVTITKPTPPHSQGDTICGSGTANLSATSTGGTVIWYDSTGTQVGTGTTYTPAIAGNVDFYVEEQFNPSPINGGPADNSFGPGGNFTGDQHLIFDCYKPSKLISVKVYAQGNGNRTFELRDKDGIVLQSTTVSVANGESVVTLNFDIPVANELQLGTPAGNQDLYRNSSGASYPYAIGDLLSINKSSAGGISGLAYYYFFYDWVVDGPDCISDRATVPARLFNSPKVQITGDTTLCSGDSVLLTASGTDIASLDWGVDSIYVFPTSDSIFGVELAMAVGQLLILSNCMLELLLH